MKFLFATKLRYFWVLIPMSILLSIAMIFNQYADGLLKLFPLIIFLIGCIIFTFVFLFRLVGFGYDEVMTAGLFSSREHVVINEGKTLIITALPKRKLCIELFGNDGVLAGLDWLSPSEDGTIPDINLFRARAIGGISSMKSVLKFYGVNKDSRSGIIAGECEYEDELVHISGGKDEKTNGKQIRIKFKATV